MAGMLDGVAERLRCRISSPSSSYTSFDSITSSLSDPRDTLEAMLRETLTRGASHSALLLGPRGTGKSSLLNSLLSSLLTEFGASLCVVRLNGLLLEGSEDRLALAEVARQLCAHHSVPFSASASQSDNLVFLRAMLMECKRVSCSVIFVLEELDAFVKSKQTMLYNLLDILQSDQVAAAVLGVSCRHDVVEMLEKRVRSRFSNRRFVFGPMETDAARKLLQTLLMCGEEGGAATEWNKGVTVAMADRRATEALEMTFMCRTSHAHIHRIATTTLTLRAIAAQDQPDIAVHASHIVDAIKMLDTATKERTVEDLSVLQLSILVALVRLQGKENETPTFEELYHEYTLCQPTGGTGGVDLYSREAAFVALEHVMDADLVSPSGLGTSKRADRSLAPAQIRQHASFQLLLSSDEIATGLSRCHNCPESLHQAFKHEVV